MTLSVSYATWATLAAATLLGRKVYYMNLGSGYVVIGGDGVTFVVAQVDDSGDVAAFEATYKAGATAVASESEALALAIAPKFTA